MNALELLDIVNESTEPIWVKELWNTDHTSEYIIKIFKKDECSWKEVAMCSRSDSRNPWTQTQPYEYIQHAGEYKRRNIQFELININDFIAEYFTELL